MSRAREQFRSVIARPHCTLAANIFDPLSARIAHMLDYDVCVLSGSVGKVSNLGVPDGVLTNMSAVVDHCRRITRMVEPLLIQLSMIDPCTALEHPSEFYQKQRTLPQVPRNYSQILL